MPSADPSRFHGLLAIAAFVLIAWLCSTARRRVNLRLVATGLLLQAAIAIVLLRIPATADAFDVVAGFVAKAISFADEGSRFVFGSLADPAGPWGFVFAFRVIPVIIFFAALMAMLYQLRVMPLVVAGMAWCLKRTLGVTATEERFKPTVFQHSKAEAKLEQIVSDPVAGRAIRVGVLLANSNFPQTRTITHTLWAMFGLLPKGAGSRA